MNFSDSEIVASVMADLGYGVTDELEQADVVMINTCSIRENAEQKVRARLQHFRAMKRHKPSMIIGVLGCMAERLKSKLLEQEQLVDLVVGPDAYKDLPGLLEQVQGGQQAVNVLLSREETYAEIAPVRLGSNGVTAFVTIMRGCDNMCSFCVVPLPEGGSGAAIPTAFTRSAVIYGPKVTRKLHCWAKTWIPIDGKPLQGKPRGKNRLPFCLPICWPISQASPLI